MLCQGREGRPLRRLEVALAAEMVADHRGHRGDTNGRLGVAVGRLKNRKAGGGPHFSKGLANKCSLERRQLSSIGREDVVFKTTTVT